MKVWPIIQKLGQEAVEAAVPIAEAAVDAVLARTPFNSFETEANALIQGAAAFLEAKIALPEAALAVAHVVANHPRISNAGPGTHSGPHQDPLPPTKQPGAQS
jgi:hypothetical protein